MRNETWGTPVTAGMAIRIGRQVSLSVLAGLLFVGDGQAQDSDLPTREEMWRVIQEQNNEIQALRNRLDATDEKVEITGEMMEETLAEGATGGEGWWDRTSLGGYGEMHYNGGDVEEIDLHRFVLFIEHDFADDWRFSSEVEIEHAFSGGGQPGEVEIEEAFIEHDFNDYVVGKGGLFLVPVGILNEKHEPPTFFGVERNRIETNILPTTWREGGVSVTTRFESGFSADLAVTSGLMTPTTGANAFKIRNGRQNVAEAVAKDPAVTVRGRYTGIPGVEFGVTGQYQADLTQGVADISAMLVEAHTDILIDGFGLRALLARWYLDSGAPGTGPAATGRDEQWGWYVEPSYRFDVGSRGMLGFFARFSQWDNNAGMSSVASAFSEFDIGVNYWPVPGVVLKADYQWQDTPAGDNDNRLNLGIGYQF